MYEDFIKGTIDSERALQVDPNKEEDPKRAAFYEVGKTKNVRFNHFRTHLKLTEESRK